MERREWADLQKYDWLEKMIKLMEQGAGTAKVKATADDKLNEKTKKLIKKRSEFKSKTSLSKMDQIELSILNKTIRREIRQDILHSEQEMIKEALEKSWSIKKSKKGNLKSTMYANISKIRELK